ncbi:membrane protein [Sulfuriferula plumbiphila]|uniref:Membrane protein n=1 Tax=Sulfuriferula plumbiphila TaxID=171865 RepID=A0A512L803_9PROT|nr:twin transmembrane helix small protein [Sulfuriferula plumbiphila]BBP02862.1 membrane protein [Sulfuriferula plumbiphila]GEP30271.1 membrane protein [Sulfuriferula plumbiphila]
MRTVVLIFIFLILASLFSALYYLIKDKGQSERTVKALTVRIVLSISLFALLMLGFHFGWLPQRSL